MKIAVVKYNAGNIYSVDYALKRLGVEATITSDKEVLMSADKVIFPGVGEAETTMSHLRKNRLDEVIKNLKQPVLGICLGMQLMCRHSEEGNADCLGIFDTDVKLFSIFDVLEIGRASKMEPPDPCTQRPVQRIHQRRICVLRT